MIRLMLPDHQVTAQARALVRESTNRGALFVLSRTFVGASPA